MIDALLFATRDAVRNAGFGYSEKTTEIMPDGKPPPRCGDIFLAVHQNSSHNDTMNYMDEYFNFYVTLTQRVTISRDRVGDQLLARNLPRRMAQNMAKATGFNAKIEQLRSFLNMNWGLLQDANNYLVNLEPDANAIYGFCEPAHFASAEIPGWAYGDWFDAEPEATDVGLKSQLDFVNCRRIQGFATYV